MNFQSHPYSFLYGPWRVLFMALGVVGFTFCARADQYAAQNGQIPGAPYTSWETAASNIQDAVNAAASGATVWVGAGHYTVPPAPTNYGGATNVVYIDRPLTLRSSNRVPETTVIDGEGMNRGITWNYKSNSASNFVIDGFTITHCTSLPTNEGGGIYFAAASWTGMVMNCIISNNAAISTDATTLAYGGGMRMASYSTYKNGLIVSNCIIRDNWATNWVGDGAGGGFSISGGGLIKFIAASGF